ncbi:MAG: alpha-E domain-containing protein [Planctomycetota bacterium]
MLARVAESIYWMARQVERAENLSRFLEVNLNFILDQPENLIDPWEPLVQVTGDTDWYHEHYSNFDGPSVANFLAFDDRYPNSMLSSLRFARENARGIREVLSSETFEQINEFYHFVNDAAVHKVEPTAEFFEQVRNHALLYNGILDGTMSHDMRWHFANAGRLLERADKTSRILDVKYFNLLPNLEDVGTAVDDIQWSALLLAISGFEAYRREHHLIDIEKVVNFFLFNRQFPRSILSCVAGADWSLSQIENACSVGQPRAAKQHTLSLRHRLANGSVTDVMTHGMHQYIDQIQTDINEVGAALNHDYFHVFAAV